MNAVSPPLADGPLNASADNLSRGYDLRQPEGDPSAVIFASPHSGTHYPASLLAALKVPLMDLRRIEDAYVDALFSGAPAAGGTLLRAIYARTFVDLNRAPDELDARMFVDGPPNPAGERSPRVEAGLGCIPRVGARGVDIYARKLRRDEADGRISIAYRPYHERLAELVASRRRQHGTAILIDCHSMPSSGHGRRMTADFVLGDRFGSSCRPSLTLAVERFLRRLGYKVARNAPYAGGYVTEVYGRPGQGSEALQIEINRRLYMDERTVLPREGFDVLQADLTRLADYIIGWSHAHLI